MKIADGSGIIISDHFNENDTYGVKRLAGMKDWLITFTLSGEGYFIINGEEKRSKAGDIAIIKSETPHCYGTRKGQIWNFVWAHFVPNAENLKWTQLPESPPGFIFHSIDNSHQQKRVLRAFKRVIHDSRQTNLHSNELCINAINEVFLLISQSLSKPIDPRVAKAIHLLETKLKEPVQIDHLAEAIGLSSSRLSHLFKAETGHSIIETLNKMRLRQAALLLEHTRRSASEVAWDVGFQNYNHFANQFKAIYGMNPMQYRNK